ncbi:MAG: helix-turn-helix transcriptional regulator [Bacteroidetes bacterium]|nr:helix-turn-helix transcriptional regulator [Bacteroidota bacterium]
MPTPASYSYHNQNEMNNGFSSMNPVSNADGQIIYFAIHPENVVRLKTFLLMNNIPFSQDEEKKTESKNQNRDLIKDVFESQLPELGLSNRESEVLREVVNGLDYQEIGNRLFISHETVRSHVKAIYRKLGVKTRAEALAKILNFRN